MKNEMELCTIIKNSINQLDNSECYKIPDPSSSFAIASQRPFDLFGKLKGNAFYCEAKFLGTPGSFDLQTIQDHQINNLLSMSKVSNSFCCVILGVRWGRGDKRLFVFKDIVTLLERRMARKNFLKKELEVTPYYKVSKDLVDFSSLVTH